MDTVAERYTHRHLRGRDVGSGIALNGERMLPTIKLYMQVQILPVSTNCGDVYSRERYNKSCIRVGLVFESRDPYITVDFKYPLRTNTNKGLGNDDDATPYIVSPAPKLTGGKR